MKTYSIEERAIQFSESMLQLFQRLNQGNCPRPISLQVVRSATSIGANIIEGRGGSTRKDFLQYLSHARKSAYETAYWLRLIRPFNPTKQQSELLEKECDEISRILTAIIIKTKRNAML